MGKAGGLIALIAGILGTLAAGATLLLGGIGKAVSNDTEVLWLGVGGLIASFATIVLGAVKMICANSALSKADSEMAVFYKDNLVAAGRSGSAAALTADIKKSQRQFIQKRNQCANDACIAEAYRARWEELAQLGFVRQ